jgi:hypothetical protein
VPVQKGEQGLLVYTSWARDGSIWICYAPGDLATRLLDEGECSSRLSAGDRRRIARCTTGVICCCSAAQLIDSMIYPVDRRRRDPTSSICWNISFYPGYG